MRLITYYRRALWLPVVVPALLVIAAFVVKSDTVEGALLGMASIFAIGLAAYAPFGLYIAYRSRRSDISEREVRKLGRATPILAGALVLVTLTVVGLIGRSNAFGGGFLLGVMTMIFGYAFVALIELGSIAGKAAGWITGPDDISELPGQG